MSSILSTIPLWVFPLLLGLIVLGLRALGDRSSPVLVIYALPLLGLLSLNTASRLGWAAVLALALAWVVGAGLGHAAQPKWTVSRSARRVVLRGEAVTMVTILTLFVVNFAVGMTQGIAPDLAGGILFAAGYGSIAGLLSGSLAGRALSVWRTPLS
ncbi:hypothetical protein [Tropicibacter oceani]|uniref:Uncharacterized protein n=1 Tax=Tropicibacter oceani TaxID=3058420 RepID=A0ABY8QH64_9RHOB|nr:hypothetical protein [Tropicibacter oceani]WGW03879.1 hypothetical protein QF118_18485 [Tropicibacter oceani]